MSLPRFFLEEQVIADEPQEVFPLRLARDDAKHAKVLRLAPGEHIAVIDAAQDYFECEIASFDDDFPLVRITRHEDATDDGPLVMLVQGLAKGEKMDSVIRHATELGVAAFMPLTCERSIVKLDAKKTRTRLDRWCSIAKSAAMQSGQPRIPEVLEPRSAKEAASEIAEATAVLICWEEAPQTASLAHAIERGLSALSSLQGEDGGFGDAGSATSESCAQVVVALSVLGIDPASDARFAKEGGSVLDALCAFAAPGGGFKHVVDGEVNGMATEQGLYALVAYERLLSGKAPLFDMGDVASAIPPDVPPDPDPSPDPDPIPTPDPGSVPSGQPSGGAESQGGAAPSDKTLFAAQTAAPSGEKMVATSSLSSEGASGEDAPDAGALSVQDAFGDQPGEDASLDAAAASDNASSPWLWVGIAAAAACVLAALGVYRARLARKEAQGEAAQ